jgi:hypothetical protein
VVGGVVQRLFEAEHRAERERLHALSHAPLENPVSEAQESGSESTGAGVEDPFRETRLAPSPWEVPAEEADESVRVMRTPSAPFSRLRWVAAGGVLALAGLLWALLK